MAWLVTGGAGYIGAHVVRAMLASGRGVVVLDDLSTGDARRLPPRVPLVRGEVRSRRAVRRALDAAGQPITGVIHLAGRIDPADSVERPLFYWSQNVGGLQVLLEELVEVDVSRFVLASSSAVYGRSLQRLSGNGHVAEATPTDPETPLGSTQLAAEDMLAATAYAEGWKAVSLRLFNVIGAGAPELGPTSGASVVPQVLRAVQNGLRPQIFGEDHPTPDGSCVRDYVHVSDVATAFVAAARATDAAHTAAIATQDATAAMRTAGEQLQEAAARVDEEARKFPGVALAADVAAGSVAAAEVAGQAAARALERWPGVSLARRLAARSLEDRLGPDAVSGQIGDVVEHMGEAASQLGSLVARVAGVDDSHRIVDFAAINVGSGRGHSVFELIESLRASVGQPFAVDIVGRRPGEPASIVASTDLARSLLGWRARLSLRDMTDTAWTAWQHDHPQD